MSMQIGNSDLGVGFVGDTTGLTRALNQAGGDVEKFGNRTRSEMRGVAREAKQTDDAMERLARGIKGAFLGGSLAVAFIGIKNSLMGVKSALIDAQVGLDRLRNGFNFGAGGMDAGAREMAFLRQEVNRLGLDLGGAASQYMKLVAASRGNAMQGEQTRQLFIAIAEASTVMGLGVDQSERAMMAVTQMMSKGKVMAEELRGQLGEQLPGAFAIAARAMGVTEIELNKLLETGQVYSADFLPKFSAQLRKELGGAVEDSTKSMQASLNRFATAWLTFKQEIVQGGVGQAINDEIKGLAYELGILTEVAERSRKSGDGFFASMANVGGAAVGRATFGALEMAAEGMNSAIKFLTGGFVDFGTELDLMPNNLKNSAAQLEALSGKVLEAEKDLARLRVLDAQPMNGNYFKGAVQEALAYVATLRAAQTELLGLQGAGAGGPAEYGNEGRREASRQADIARQTAQTKAAADFWAKNMTPAQKMNAELKAMRESLGGMFTPDIEAQIRKNYIKPVRDSGSAVREAEAAERERASTLQKIADMQDKAGDAYQKDADALMNSNDALRTEIELIGLDEAGRRALMIVKEQELLADRELLLISLQNADADATTIANLEREINLRKQRIGLLGQQSVALEAEAAAKAATKAAEEYTKDAEKLREREAAEWAKTWDQVGQSFTDALMQGGKSVKQYLEGLFRTMVLRPLLAPITGAVTSMVGGPAAAGQGGGAASGSGILSSLGNIGLAASAFGTGMAASFSSMMAAGVSGWATAAGSLIGTGSLAGIAAGVGMIAAPLAAAALLYKPLFGRKLKDTGIEGTFSGTDGLSANTYQFYKGGLFRSNKTTRSALDEGMRSGLAQQYAALTSQNATNAGALGLDAGGLANFSSSFGFSTNGMSEQQIGERFSQEFAAIADAQASLLLGTAAFNRAGESSSEALQRLAGSLVSVNAAFEALGKSALAGLQGADLASKLLDAFGGAEAFTAQTSAYYEAFYTQAERTNTATRQLTEVLAGLGLALPESRTAFRELVEAQDLYTDAGRSTYAALIGLAPVFDQITQATEQMGKALSDEVLRLRGLLTGSSVNSIGALQTDFAIATAAARAGDAGALERLPAISQALESAAALQAVTAADLALVRGQLTASLSQTMQALGLDVPQFAVGTNYVPRDMLAKIHEGEAIVPKAYNPAAGGSMGNTARLEAQLERMAAELAELKNIMAADVGHNAKTARILERVTPDGTSLSTVVAA